MPLTIVFDTGPLGVVTKKRGLAETDACREWVAACRQSGHAVIVPAIALFEVARELERLGNRTGLARLDKFCDVPRVYLPLHDDALRLAIKLWATARNAGMPTADPKELDCDVLIAALALNLGLRPDELVVATYNVGHLTRYVTAMSWRDVKP